MPDHAWAKFQPSGGLGGGGGGGLSVTKRGQRRSSGRRLKFVARLPWGEGGTVIMLATRILFSPNSSKNRAKLHLTTYPSSLLFFPRLSNLPFQTKISLAKDKKETLRWKDYARYAACSNLNWEEGGERSVFPSLHGFFLFFFFFHFPSLSRGHNKRGNDCLTMILLIH